MRFKLSTLMLAVVGGAIYVASTRSVYATTALTLLFAPVTVGGIIYSRDAHRAFWIGCAAGMAVASPVIWPLARQTQLLALTTSPFESWVYFGVAHGFIICSGGLVVVVRWFYAGIPKPPLSTKAAAGD